jgi:glycosyltransferase involved in cell wall biosynthesis
LNKILLIAHYFPPLNSTGSRRPESMVKNFKSFGFEVTVLTTKKGIDSRNAAAVDNEVKVFQSSLMGTIKTPLVGYFESKSHGDGNPTLKKIKQKVFNPFFGQIGDPRLFFVFQVYLKILFFKISNGNWFKWLSEIKSCDYIVSTSPPWPCHLLACIIAKQFKKKLIIDYRDQFSLNHMFSQNLKFLDLAIDKYLCRRADLIVVISEPMKEYYQSITSNRVEVIMNGFESESFQLIEKSSLEMQRTNNESIVVRYFGTITNDRIMKPLWEAISQNASLKRYHFEFYGESDLLQKYLNENNLDKSVSISFYKSVSHKKALVLMSEADMLLFTETSDFSHASQRGVLTTKLFEYMASLKPIISIIDSSTIAGQIIEKSGLSFLLTNSKDEIENGLSDLNKLKNLKPNLLYISSFSRKSQFTQLKNLLNEI